MMDLSRLYIRHKRRRRPARRKKLRSISVPVLAGRIQVLTCLAGKFKIGRLYCPPKGRDDPRRLVWSHPAQKAGNVLADDRVTRSRRPGILRISPSATASISLRPNSSTRSFVGVDGRAFDAKHRVP